MSLCQAFVLCVILLQGDLPDYVVPLRDIYARISERGLLTLHGKIPPLSAAGIVYIAILITGHVASQPGSISWLQRINLQTGRLLQGQEWEEVVAVYMQVR